MAAWLLLACAPFGDAPAPASAAALAGLARDVLLQALPERYESAKDWGRTTGRFDYKHLGGLKFERRVKQVNHGLWKKYAVSPIEPRQRMALRVANVVRKSPGVSAFTAIVEAPLAAEATAQSWSYGVKLFGATVEAEATVLAEIDCELEFAMRVRGLAPEFTVAPRVLAVRTGLHDFKLKKLGGLLPRLARELEDEAAGLVRKRLRDQEGKLAEKANAALRKKRPDGRYAWSPLDGMLR
jgi:hypothetical protein